MVFDVSDEAQCKALVAKTIERFGKIDILINNAALYAPLPTLKVTEIDVELWDKVMAINIRGPFLMVKHVAPHMIAQEIRQDRQHRLGHGGARHPGLLALRHLEGRGDGVHPLHVARARRARHLRQHAGAGLYAVRHRPDQHRACRGSRKAGAIAAPRAQARRSSPRICWAR